MQTIESPGVRGIAHEDALVLWRFALAARGRTAFCAALADSGIVVRSLWSSENSVEILVARNDAPQLRALLDDEGVAAGAEVRDDVASITVIGSGLDTRTGIAATVLKQLAQAGVEVHLCATSPHSITCVIGSAMLEQALETLHAHLHLAG